MHKKSVYFLPWLKVETPIQIGPVEFWPYYKEKNKRLNDEKIKIRLDSFFKQYVRKPGRPVETITIVSYLGKEFEPLDEEALQTIKNAVFALAFSYMVPHIIIGIAKNQEVMGPPSSNIFELREIRFSLNNTDYWGIKAGSILIGSRINEIYFYYPLETGGEIIYGPDKRLFELFNFLLERSTGELSDKEKELKHRLFQSLYWFFMAHIEGWHISELFKVVMMTTAFETLLALPRHPKKSKLMEEIERRIANTDKFLEEERNIKGRLEKRKKICWWANDLYELRSKIVHGNIITGEELVYKDWISYLIAAELVFSHMVILELLDRKKKLQKFEQIIGRTLLLNWDWNYTDAYKRLGWIR